MAEIIKSTWRYVCENLQFVMPAEKPWSIMVDNSPPNDIWHSLDNCIAHQVTVWSELISGGAEDASQPVAFRLALLLRHTPAEQTVKVLNELLVNHPQSADMSSYILALLSDVESYDDAFEAGDPPHPAPARDAQLFTDAELAVLGASVEQYDRHADLVRQEYKHLTDKQYRQLRIKVLEQFLMLPAVFDSAEFSHLEPVARENIAREISRIKLDLV